MIQRCFDGSGVPASAAELGKHRARQVDITQVGLEQNRNLCVCVQRPAHQVSPPSIARRLAGARYQLDL